MTLGSLPGSSAFLIHTLKINKINYLKFNGNAFAVARALLFFNAKAISNIRQMIETIHP
jgi:hypothetical protein